MKKKGIVVILAVMVIGTVGLFAERSMTNGLGKSFFGQMKPASLRYKVTCYGVNLRTGPSPNQSIICELSQGTIVNWGGFDEHEAIDENGNRWLAVVVQDGAYAGTFGWVIASCLAFD